jgi:20S proteasome alpha/beta subunit
MDKKNRIDCLKSLVFDLNVIRKDYKPHFPADEMIRVALSFLSSLIYLEEDANGEKHIGVIDA